MIQTVIHRSNSRGHANHGWLDAHHSFSFAGYHNPSRMHFGVLRVLNDDRIDAGMGFGNHPHANMEIITIPLKGELSHRDSMGNNSIIRAGEIQVMSAGTGIEHSEFNSSSDDALCLLQIWLFPNKSNVVPRYDQQILNLADRHNKLQQILSPNPDDDGVWIYQDAWFHLGKFDHEFSFDYALKMKSNGVYIFVLSGDFNIDGHELKTRDAIGIWDTDLIKLESKGQSSEILIMEVPMNM